MTPIDKDELLKVLRQRYDNLKQWYKNTTNEDAKTNAAFAMAECFEIGNIVKEQPTVDAVERRKGKWIDKSAYCVCNQCGHTEQQFNGVEPIPLHTPFCAMCGADMRAFEKMEAENA